MSGGYVYVIEFCSGTVKVGHTQSLANRMRQHKQAARRFGLTVARSWESPCHDGFRQNEDTLKRLARELGGTPTTAEYFNGVIFDALVEKAAGLPFPDPAPAPVAAPARVVASASAEEEISISDDPITRTTLREQAKREARKSWVARFFIERGATPQVMRIISSRMAESPEIDGMTELAGSTAELAGCMEIQLRQEARVRRLLGEPPVPYRPFIGGHLPA